MLSYKLDADGCHLGQKDMNIEEARKIIGNKIVGITCHNPLVLAKKAIKYDQVSSYSFDVKERLLERIIYNLDDVDITLKHKEQIEAYELSRRQQRPWLFDYSN